MATITAAQAGNWSATGTWTGGVVPGIGDTADLNGFSVAFDAGVAGLHIQCDSIISPTGNGAITIAMDVIGSCEITCSGNIEAGQGSIITVTGSAPAETLTVNASTILGGTTSNKFGILMQSDSALVVVANVTGGSASNALGILGTSTGDATITGNVTGGSHTTAEGAEFRGNGITVTINGDVQGAGGSGLFCTGIATIIVNGDVFGGTSNSILGLVASDPSIVSITVNGNVTGGTNTGTHGINNTANHPLVITGDVTGGLHVLSNGVLNTGGAVCTISGSLIHGQSGSKGVPISGGTFILSPDPGSVVTDSAGTDAFTAGAGGGGGAVNLLQGLLS